MKKPLKIAFYGKGGIGKSTIACNLSALLAEEGKKILHIGCDPKADATRLLTDRRIPTVLEQLGRKEKLCREDMVFEGREKISCVEAGGPEAGQGCAGLGITTAMNELTDAGVFQEDWDVILYDVLGDVVCGGFSVPMRRHFADRVYVVTSASGMSLYAANNILKGICRYSGSGEPLFGGLIVNHIRDSRDMRMVEAFAEKTGAGILCALLEDDALARCDLRRRLLVKEEPRNDNVLRLQRVAEKIQWPAAQVLPRPFSPEALEHFQDCMAEELYGSTDSY